MKLGQCLSSQCPLVGAFNQEKALVGAFSLFVQLCRLIICSTSHWSPGVVVLEDHDEDLHHLLQLHGPRPVLVVQPELPPQLLLGRPRGLQRGEVRGGVCSGVSHRLVGRNQELSET